MLPWAYSISSLTMNPSMRDEKNKNNHSLWDFLLKTYTSLQKNQKYFLYIENILYFCKKF